MTQPPGLRHADWRFLLPKGPDGRFRRMVLLNGSAGLTECIRQTGLAEEVSSRLPASGSVDALIVLGASHSALRDAAHRLSPGGVLYLELEPQPSWYAALALAQAGQALVSLGLRPVATYLTSRDPARREVYLPLDSRGALRWFSGTFVAARTPVRRLLTPILTRSGTMGFFPGLVHNPRQAIVAVAAHPGDMPPALLAHASLPAPFRTENACTLLVTPGADDVNRVIMLPFARNGCQPLGVLKLSRRTEGNDLAEQEQAVLTSIRRKLSPRLRQTIPEPFGTVRWRGQNVGLESCAPGHSLTVALGAWGTTLSHKISYLRRAAQWLVDFHRESEVRRIEWGSADSREWLEEPLTSYRSCFGATEGEERLFAAVLEQSARLKGELLPVVTVHWNFSMSHIFASDRQITVVDWEGVAPGPPLFDLLFFGMHWVYTVRRLAHEGDQLAGFRDLFCRHGSTDPVASAVHNALAKYMGDLAIDRRFYPLLLVLMCVFRALGRINRREEAVTEAEARKGNRYVRYIELLSDQVDELFPEQPEQAQVGGVRVAGS